MLFRSYEPEFILGPDLKARRLVPVLTSYSSATGTIHAVYPSHRYLSAKVRTFVDFLAKRFAHTSWA